MVKDEASLTLKPKGNRPMTKYLTTKPILAAITFTKQAVDLLETSMTVEKAKGSNSNVAYIERALNAAQEAYKQALLMLDDLETPAGWDTAVL